MLDIQWIKNNPEAFDKALARRNEPAASALVLEKDAARRDHIAQVQKAQELRNSASKAIGAAKAKGDEALASQLMQDVADLKAFLKTAEETERKLNHELEDLLIRLPNVPHEDVPQGKNEEDNQLIRHEGKPLELDFAIEHFDLGRQLHQMDFEAAAKMSGARFVVLRSDLARLERALGQFMLNMHVEQHGYMEVCVPVLLRDHALYGTAQLPKFSEDLFKTNDDRWLAPTAEVPLTNLMRDTLLDAFNKPYRFAALTPCFRSEAGAAGRDTRGIMRQHQFNKVELVSMVQEGESEAELERMTQCAEAVLKALGLSYRVMLLCSGDMGFSAKKTYDLEVWLPGQKAYREISSCSMCGAFQARRMMARYRDKESGEPRFMHTLNGSGVAVGRALIAVMETYQNEDGSVTVPEVLRPFMGGQERIEALKE